MRTLSSTFNSIQKWLFPALEEEIGKLTENQCEFIRIVELIDPERFMNQFNWSGQGRPLKARQDIFKAFIAKGVYNYPTTKVLIDVLNSSPSLRRLCGWEYRGSIPSESTFSRAFTEFSKAELLKKIHSARVKEHLGSKLVGHVSRDSTSIKAREKSCRKSKPKHKKGKRGRPKKDQKKFLSSHVGLSFSQCVL